MPATLEDQQREICARFESAYLPPSSECKIGLALNSLNKNPIYGVRVAPTSDTSGWYIWGGAYSTDPEFYEPIHLAHLPDWCPIALKYLALAPGFKFIIDSSGFEDVWFEDASANKT